MDAKLPAATWSMFTPRNNPGQAPVVPGQNISAQLGTRWEPPALVTTLGGFVPLTCAPLHLLKHSGVLVARIRMHAWGSRGPGSKARRPQRGGLLHSVSVTGEDRLDAGGDEGGLAGLVGSER
jgi:hypothetical protein